MPGPRIRSAAGLAAVCWALSSGASEAQSVADPGLSVEVAFQFFATPTSMTFIGPDDFLLLEKSSGRVRRITAGVPVGFVLDVNVEGTSERGLLGITKDPDFVNNGYVYLYYTEAQDTDGGPALGNRVYRYHWNGSLLEEPLLILDLPLSDGNNHNGGIVTFGRDDRLYTVIGDLNHFGQLQNVATGPPPDDSGVILRTDGYGRALVDNPFYDRTAPHDPLGRYWAYGVRNSFGLAIDPVSGDLWDTENGDFDYDEINRVARGFNSGWLRIMGPDARSAGNQSDLWHAPGSEYSDPEFSWLRTIAPTALQFVASRRMGCALEHTLLVGDVNCGQLRRFRLDAARQALDLASPELADLVADNSADVCNDEQAETIFGEGFPVVGDIENGPDGFLYVVVLGTNTVYRIRPVEPVAGDSDGDLVPDACDCGPADPQAFAQPVEAPRIRPSRAGTLLRLGWDDQGATAGAGTTYVLASGSLTQLRAARGFGDACTPAAPSSATTFSDARPDPAPDDGYYYLVRAVNACAAGTYGQGGGAEDPRDLLDAAALPSCN